MPKSPTSKPQTQAVSANKRTTQKAKQTPTNSKPPKVSALMPIYNTNLTYLKETIDSVLAQSFADFEFLILNDSPQNAKLESFVLDYAKKDSRIKYHKNEQNLGISSSRNKLIDLAQGEFLAIIDHDDISVEKRFEKQVAFLDANADVGVVGGDILTMKKQTIQPYPKNSVDIKIALMQSCCLMHPTAMLRKSVLTQSKCRYNAFYSPAEDYKLWCDLIKFTEFANVGEVLIHYRDYENTSKASEAKMHKLTQAIIDDNKAKHPELFNLSLCLKQAKKDIKVAVFGLPLFRVSCDYPHTRFYLLGLPLFRITYVATMNKFLLYIFEKIRIFKFHSDFKGI